MERLFTIHCVAQEKLTRVIAEMRALGPPCIRVVNCGDFYMAIEGTHRIAAAEALGVAPLWYVLEQDDLVDSSSLDLDYLFGGVMYRAADLVDEVYSTHNGAYLIGQNGTLSSTGFRAASLEPNQPK